MRKNAPWCKTLKGLEKKDVQLFQLACLTNALRKGAILLIYLGTFLTTLHVMADDFCQSYEHL
jgi:hypothetical protein